MGGDWRRGFEYAWQAPEPEPDEGPGLTWRPVTPPLVRGSWNGKLHGTITAEADGWLAYACGSRTRPACRQVMVAGTCGSSIVGEQVLDPGELSYPTNLRRRVADTEHHTCLGGRIPGTEPGLQPGRIDKGQSAGVDGDRSWVTRECLADTCLEPFDTGQVELALYNNGRLAGLVAVDPPGLSPITTVGRFDTVEAAQVAADEVWASRGPS